jgi:acetyl esterase/lipase
VFAHVSRAFIASLVVGMSVMCLCAPAADASFISDLLGLGQPPPAAPVTPPVAAPLAADPPTGGAAGTMIMVFGSAWAGHYAPRQEQLMDRPGDLLRRRGWRVVSVDYEEGTAGLQSVLSVVGDELARKTGPGPLCIYGESSGAELALVAAAQQRSIDCVVGVATPTDLAYYESQGSSAAESKVRDLAARISSIFGTTPEALAPWSPVVLAPAIHADVMLIHESDDTLIDPGYATRFQALRPTTKVVMLEPGDPTDPAAAFAHGTVSDSGRARYFSAVGSFADRELAAHDAERSAQRTGCPQVARTIDEIGRADMLSALRCLALKDGSLPDRSGAWRRSVVRAPGEVNPARVWAALRRSAGGRGALLAIARRRARMTVRAGDPTRVTLSARR